MRHLIFPDILNVHRSYRFMNLTSIEAYHVATVGTCGLFLCALTYFLFQVLHLYFNRKILVECWFCRSLSTVKVSDRNAFFCISCKQYNGFTESGDYNRPLPAQYEANLNPYIFTSPRNLTVNNSKSDILCVLCAQRQAYKIDQLARFEPSNEASWDQELDQFKKELEGRCVLCPSCTIKVHRRINQVLNRLYLNNREASSLIYTFHFKLYYKLLLAFIVVLATEMPFIVNILILIDAKILPSVLSWWRNRCNKNSSVDSLPNEHYGFSRSSTSLCIILSFLRIITTLIWLVLGISPFLGFFHYHICHLHSASPIRLIFRKLALHIPQRYCEYVADWKSALTIQPSRALWGYVLCLFGHLVLLLQTLQPTTSPIRALLDFVLIVLAADLAITCQDPSSIQALLLGLLPVAGIGIFSYNWLSYRKRGIGEQKRKLTTWSPLASSHNKEFAYDNESAAPSRLPKTDTLGARSLSLDKLSLHSSSSPTAYSAIFSPPTLVSLPPRSHFCASSTAPDYTRLRQGVGDHDDMNEVMSHFTSVSQRSMCRRGHSKRPHRKRRLQQPVGLLRWVVYLLFGRLEKWEDVKAELVCLLNAVLVAVLLILICHLFYSIVPALWGLKL
ncbi:unnamed protein product [Hydatigera taeniaeformis]|uniref:Ima1_N domain-containing protein n=1 Tax=Hydatigena taeniaeformis TaxID=6205 RepID=A0A0R3WJS4_HYDTA|nr:unnamed protein product [Hydatigera taeniaeformis]